MRMATALPINECSVYPAGQAGGKREVVRVASQVIVTRIAMGGPIEERLAGDSFARIGAALENARSAFSPRLDISYSAGSKGR